MVQPNTLSGFPPGEIIFRSHDENFSARIHKIANNLVNAHVEQAPNITYEGYELNLAAPNDDMEEAVALQWPISHKQYEAFWHPQVEKPDNKVSDAAADVEVDPLNIFKPEQSIEEEDDYDPEAASRARKEQERALLAARLFIVNSVLDELPNDAFIQDYINSFGVFDREQGQQPPLGFHLDDLDRNIFYRQEDHWEPIFGLQHTSRGSNGSIDTITSTHTSLVDGTVSNSKTKREQWEASLRDDIRGLVTKLQDVPKHYLDLFDERGFLFSDEHYGTARQIGTNAVKEFFAGYYQFAPAGTSLLKAERRSNLFGAINYKTCEDVYDISTIYVAHKHGIAGRPHLVRLRAIDLGDPYEPSAEVHVFEYPSPLDGEMYNHRIGGEYGDMKRDPQGDVDRMQESVRNKIDPSTLELIKRGESVGTEITNFSHEDFFSIVKYLSTLALSASDY